MRSLFSSDKAVPCRVERDAYNGREGLGRRRRKQHAGESPSGDRVGRTVNMPLITVTLDVSKLNGWLNAVALCRESEGGHTKRGEVRAGRLEGGGSAVAQVACRLGPECRCFRACPVAPSLQLDPPRACRLHHHRTHTTLSPPGPHLTPLRMPALRLAASVIVQPAAEFRHVQGDKHAHHVYGALSRMPWLPAFHPRARRL